jgi:ABC-type transport system involved in multi-copper enzyme maturation permease subunit
MNAVATAELLRLRTVRAPRWGALVGLLVVALNAAPFLNGAPTSAVEIANQLRSLMLIVAFFTALYAAHTVAEDFKRGAVAVTYLAHPHRSRVAAALAGVHALLSAAFGAVAAAVALGIVLPVAASDGVPTGLSSLDIVLVIAGTAFSSGVFGASGVLVGTITRQATSAMVSIAFVNFAEAFATGGGQHIGGVDPYLPFQLVGATTGLTHSVPPILAMVLELAYLGALALVVRLWALQRDLT